jgi:hypothetical protein
MVRGMNESQSILDFRLDDSMIEELTPRMNPGVCTQIDEDQPALDALRQRNRVFHQQDE